MDTYTRLLKYVLPYWKRIIFLFITITVFASLSGVSVTLIPPFLKIILYGDELEVSSGSEPGGAEAGLSTTQGIPLPARIEEMKSAAVIDIFSLTRNLYSQ